MFRDLEPQLSRFQDLDDKAHDELLRNIIEIANQDKIAFSRYVKGLYGKNMELLDLLFEAIFEYPEGWEEFITKEIKRIFDLAEESKSPKDLLRGLFYLTIVEVDSEVFYEKNIRLLSKRLYAKHPAVRYYAFEAIVDLADSGNVTFDQEMIGRLKDLLKDRNWRIRHNAFKELKELKVIPKDTQMSWTDRLRAKFFVAAF